MEPFLYVNLLNERKLLQNLEQIPDVTRGVLLDKVRVWTEKMREAVIGNIISRLKQKTGLLAQSVEIEIIQEGIRVEGRVYIAGVPYAQAQEKGAVMPAHIIRPRDAKILAFIAATGDKVFATHVFHPGGIIPGTFYMKDAYRTMSPKVTGGLYYELVRKLRDKMRTGL